MRKTSRYLHGKYCIANSYSGVFIDVKSINLYHFRQMIDNLCRYRIGISTVLSALISEIDNPNISHITLKDQDNLIGLFENSNYDKNVKNLENLYHEFVLTRGDFDERIFLDNKADHQIGTPVKVTFLVFTTVITIIAGWS